MHPDGQVVRTGSCRDREPGGKSRELVFQRGEVGLGQVAADQAQVQIPALRAAVGALDPRGDDVRVAGMDDALGCQPVQASTHGALGQAGVADQGGCRGERAGAVRPGVVGQADEHELARAGRLAAAVRRDRGQVERPRDRLDSHLDRFHAERSAAPSGGRAASGARPGPVWSGSLLPATGSARNIAGDSLHRVSSPALSAPRPILKGPLTPAHFHAVAAPPRQDDSFLVSFTSVHRSQSQATRGR